MSNALKFDGRASHYAASRPSYAPTLIDCMFDRYDLSPQATIADVGSGTGKLAAQLLSRGCQVYCVEPNLDMRTAAEAALGAQPGFHSVPAPAEATTLGNATVDFITAAQAFHWFDGVKFRQECQRILRPGGKVFLIWNTRDPRCGINQDLAAAFAAHCPTFKGFSEGLVQDDPRIQTFFGGQYDYVTFDHPLHYNRDSFISRCLSSSYSLKAGDAGYPAYIQALNRLFEQWATDGTVSVGNHSVAYIGTLK